MEKPVFVGTVGFYPWLEKALSDFPQRFTPFAPAC
jgi:hypothetical protein